MVGLRLTVSASSSHSPSLSGALLVLLSLEDPAGEGGNCDDLGGGVPIVGEDPEQGQDEGVKLQITRLLSSSVAVLCCCSAAAPLAAASSSVCCYLSET